MDSRQAMLVDGRWAKYWTELLELIKKDCVGGNVVLTESLASYEATFLASYLFSRIIRRKFPPVDAACAFSPGDMQLAGGIATMSCLSEPPGISRLWVRHEAAKPPAPWPWLDGVSKVRAGADVVVITDGMLDVDKADAGDAISKAVDYGLNVLVLLCVMTSCSAESIFNVPIVSLYDEGHLLQPAT